MSSSKSCSAVAITFHVGKTPISRAVFMLMTRRAFSGKLTGMLPASSPNRTRWMLSAMRRASRRQKSSVRRPTSIPRSTSARPNMLKLGNLRRLSRSARSSISSMVKRISGSTYTASTLSGIASTVSAGVSRAGT